MGFADVGADVFLAIGLVAAYSAGLSPVAFLIASLCYISTGLVYAELTSLYPYAGGGQVFGTKAGGDLLGFIVGWSLLMSYVIDIGLFSIIAAGYLSFIFPILKDSLYIQLFNLNFKFSFIGITALIIVTFLIILNIIGIKESSLFNELFVIITIATEMIILALAFPLAFDIPKFMGQLTEFGVNYEMPNVFYTGLLDIKSENFIYGITIAMSSFIGIESIAQAAEETRNPWRHIPKAFKYSVIAVFALTITFSILGLGVLGWRGLAENVYNPIATITYTIPIIGPYLSVAVATVAFAISMVSTNTGVIGVSRIVYSMSRFRLFPHFLSKLHEYRATPYIGIIVFGFIGGLLALTGGIYFVASLYSFGALLSYLLINYCHIKLRNIDKDAYRPWKTPMNIKIGEKEISLLSVIGLLITGGLFILTIIYHYEGRILGLIWVAAGIIFFYIYRLFTGGIRYDLAVKMIPPAIPYIRTLIYVPLFSNIRYIAGLIENKIGRINELYIVTVIPRYLVKKDGIDEAELTRLRKSQTSAINNMCRYLSQKYRCHNHVIIADTVEKGLLKIIDELDIEQVAIPVYKRRRVKRKTEIVPKINKKVQVIFLS